MKLNLPTFTQLFLLIKGNAALPEAFHSKSTCASKEVSLTAAELGTGTIPDRAVPIIEVEHFT